MTQLGPLDQEEFPDGLCIDVSGREEKFSTLAGSAFSPARAPALDGKQAWLSSSAGRRRRRGSCHLGCRPSPTLQLPPSSSLHSCSSGCSPLISLPHTGLPAFTLHHFSPLRSQGCLLKTDPAVPNPPATSPHPLVKVPISFFFFSSLLPPFYSKIRTEIRLFLTLIPL